MNICQVHNNHLPVWALFREMDDEQVNIRATFWIVCK